MPSAENRSTYHHGALREELITACLALIESEGIGAVNLRRVAREAGVSAGAPYHHFTDRAALLRVISARGYERLIADLGEARRGAVSPVEAIGAMLAAYVRFARGHTAYIQLMYRPELSGSLGDPAVRELATEGLRLLKETVVECQRAGLAPSGDPAPLVTLIWSVATGLAMLSIEGPLEGQTAARGSTVEEFTDQIGRLLQSLLDGTATR